MWCSKWSAGRRAIWSAREARRGGCHPKWRRVRRESTFTSGLDDETSATVGPGLSRGEVIRKLMRSRRPCRFTSLSGDAQAMGFPSHHPPVHSFLGTAIYSAEDAHGWFCLTNKLGAESFHG